MYFYFTFIILIILLPILAMAGIVNVPGDQPTIQAGITAVVNGDTVLVADGLYYENINFMGKAITVASYFLVDSDSVHIDSTIINGSQPSHPDSGSVVSFVSGEDTTSVLCGFTITGGTGTSSDGTSRVGGGIYCYLSGSRIIHNKIINNTITNTGEARGGGIGTFPWGNNNYTIIEDNIIESNSCISDLHAQGGGIWMPQGKIDHNIIRSNSVQGNFTSVSALGGGIHAACAEYNQRYLHVTHNLIENNQCTNSTIYSRGGGVETWGGVVIYLINNNIKNNQLSSLAQTNGGGVNLVFSEAPSIIQGNTIAFNSLNSLAFGAGIELSETQGVQIIGNRIEGNDGANIGGGIDVQESSGTLIRGNEIIFNTADTSGGGLAIQISNDMIIDQNIFRGNSAKYGGGIFKFNGNFSIKNNILIENEARWGGGIYGVEYPQQSFLTKIINNTLHGNVADTAGGIWLFDMKAMVLNTICWGNSAAFAQEIYIKGSTMDIAYSDIRFGADSIQVSPGAALNWLDGNISKDPMLRGDSLMLSDSSSCIGAGTIFYQFGSTILYCPSPCFLGHTRPSPVGTNPDMGACESLREFPVVSLENPFSNPLPTSFELKQNYPNPFNPITVISWQLAVGSPVKLTVYNLAGQRVTDLLNEYQPAGLHSTELDASELASGVYLYRLEAGEYAEVRKMILMK